MSRSHRVLGRHSILDIVLKYLERITVHVWIVNLIFLIAGAILGFLSSIGTKKYEEKCRRKKLKRIIQENLDHILSGMQTVEAAKIQGWKRGIENPNISFRATSYYPHPANIEELKEDLFLFNDPLPKKILDIVRLLRFYRELHEMLVQKCTDITLGCQSFDECTMKLKDQWFKEEILKPIVFQIDEIRERIIEGIRSVGIQIK